MLPHLIDLCFAMELNKPKHEKPKFHHPGNMCVYGPSKSGKTVFVSKLIKHRDKMYTMESGKKFQSILYFYGSVWQPRFTEMKRDGATFVKGFQGFDLEKMIPQEKRPALVVIDDLETELQDSKNAQNLVSIDSHHMDLSVILIFQSLFPVGKFAVKIRDQLDISVFMRYSNNDLSLSHRFKNMFSNKQALTHFIQHIYKKWTKDRGGYLLIDNHPDQIEQDFSIRTNIFPTDPFMLACVLPNVNNF